jgi:hypothetical protein
VGNLSGGGNYLGVDWFDFVDFVDFGDYGDFVDFQKKRKIEVGKNLSWVKIVQ